MLETKRIYLVHNSFLSEDDINILLPLINGELSYPINLYKWEKSDLIFLNDKLINFYCIRLVKNNELIGYLSISAELIFEIALADKYRNKGFSIESSILLFDFWFSNNSSNKIYTNIFKDNIKSISSAISFGWQIDSYSQTNWINFILRESIYKSSDRINLIRNKYKISI